MSDQSNSGGFFIGGLLLGAAGWGGRGSIAGPQGWAGDASAD